MEVLILGHPAGRPADSGTAEPTSLAKTLGQLHLVLLAAGHVRQDFVNIMDVTSPAMLPYMGRPLIYITVLNFLRLDGRRVLVVLPEGEQRVKAFLRSAFGDRIALSIVRAPHRAGATPLQSLEAAFDVMARSGADNGPALISYSHYEKRHPEGSVTARCTGIRYSDSSQVIQESICLHHGVTENFCFH